MVNYHLWTLLTHFMPLVIFYSPWKNEKKAYQWHKMSWEQYLLYLKHLLYSFFDSFFPSRLKAFPIGRRTGPSFFFAFITIVRNNCLLHNNCCGIVKRSKNCFLPLILTRMWLYHGVRNVNFSGNFMYVLNGWSPSLYYFRLCWST